METYRCSRFGEKINTGLNVSYQVRPSPSPDEAAAIGAALASIFKSAGSYMTGRRPRFDDDPVLVAKRSWAATARIEAIDSGV